MSSKVHPRLAALVAVAAATALGLSIAAFGGALTSASADTMGETPHAETVAAPKGMRVSLQVREDAMMGWNLRLKTNRFRWAPEHANQEHVRGEGHAHLYIDGVKTTRLYGPWYYLKMLEPGQHTIRVTLNGNEHADYVRKGKRVADSAVVTAP